MADEPGIVTAGPIGKPEDRVDGRLKVTGAAKYSAEFGYPGLVYGVLIMSTVAAAEIAAMDTDAASRLPGVRLIMTPFNAMRIPEFSAANGAKPTRQFGNVLSLLQDKHVYYQNQPIGVAVADTLEAAQHAAGLVRVTYDSITPATDIDKEKYTAYAPGVATFVPTDSSRGDADGAFASAPKQMRHVYSTPVENHNPMEPHATVAIWDAPDMLTVHDSTQGIFGVQGTLAGLFQIPRQNVRCITYFVGGGFGCKGSVWSHVPLAAMAAKQIGRPVKLVLARSDMFGMVGYRPITQQTIALGADNAGKLLSVRHDVHTQTAVFDEFVEPSAAATRMLYACPNASTSHRVTRLNYGKPTYMRAPGESSGTFAIESAMDELSYEVGIDPLKLRLTNYAETDPDQNKPFSRKSLRECYTTGAERFGWDKRTPNPRSLRTRDGLLIGMGLGTATYPARRQPASASARILADGTAIAQSGTQDIGTGTYTVMTQVAAGGLGLPFDKVRFQLGDTRLPQSPGSGGSTTAASTGSAVLAAAQAARSAAIAAAIADPASPLHALSADAIDVIDGRMFAKGWPQTGETYAALLERQKLPYIEAEEQAQPDPSVYGYSTHSFGAAFTEVHVDPDLGIVRVARVVGVYGVGNRLNAKTARSQLMGGIVWGIGMALTERTMIDKRTGRVVNADLAEYHVPVNADVPDIDVAFVEESDSIINPLGIKGIGEIGITGVVGSICNAVYHATGVRVRDLPLTLDKIIAA